MSWPRARTPLLCSLSNQMEKADRAGLVQTALNYRFLLQILLPVLGEDP